MRRLSEWQNNEYYSLVQDARYSLDRKERMAMYQGAERILVSEAPILPLVYGGGTMFVKPWIKNYFVSPFSPPFWKDVIIEPH
jgi:ABC-type transport system substrate-binding protein